MLTLKKQQQKLPKSPGVYFFYSKAGRLLYIGKATLLRTRVASYLRPTKDPKTQKLVQKIHIIKHQKTDTALEALFLEAELIKKHQPPYNIRQKDDKTSAYLVITQEKFPRLIVTRPTSLHRFKIKSYYGPFQSKKELDQALKILRRVFPYHSEKNFQKPCFHYQINLCPGPCADAISEKDYQKNIKNLELIFAGKKKHILSRLKKQMATLSKNKEFEKAAAIRDTLAALTHLRDIPLSQKEVIPWRIIKDLPPRLEAYDISNTSGKEAVGSMVVFTFGRADKAEYRRFKIKSKDTPDDTAMLREVLERRFHNDWPRPSVIFVDGGLGHLRAAQMTLRSLNIRIPIIAGAKGPTRKNFRVFKSHKNLNVNRDLLKEASLEAHRFAITYHRKIRDRKLI